MMKMRLIFSSSCSQKDQRHLRSYNLYEKVYTFTQLREHEDEIAILLNERLHREQTA